MGRLSTALLCFGLIVSAAAQAAPVQPKQQPQKQEQKQQRQAYTYEAPGPCAVRTAAFSLALPAESGCRANECAVEVRLTTPTGDSGGGGCPAAPWPVVTMVNGFSARAEFYADLADHIASYGYAALQYTFAAALIVEDARELNMLPFIYAAVKERLAAAGRSQQLDWKTQAAVGHSRGGKIAALLLAGSSGGAGSPPGGAQQQQRQYRTAVLIDPVDNTAFSPEGPLYPSAVKALAAAARQPMAAVIGAGVRSLCNPEDANYARFYDAGVGAGSWRVLFPGATHQDFASVGGLPLPPVCGAGSASPAAVRRATRATAAAWLGASLRGADASGFLKWLAAQGPALAQFSVKGAR